jgi:putative endonuclease
VTHAAFQFCVGRALSPAQNCDATRTTCHGDGHSVLGVSGDRRSELGRLGEQLAAEHLARCGFEIVERNYRTRWGELDIVAFDGRTLAFCEVKARRMSPGGAGPLEAVRSRKRSRVRKMARSWLVERTDRPRADRLRFDAIGVTFDLAGRLVALEHVEGAF